MKFYKVTAEDPRYAKLVLSTLQKRNDPAPADDLIKPLDKLDSHMATQLMKSVATLHAINKTKKAGRGDAARGK